MAEANVVPFFSEWVARGDRLDTLEYWPKARVIEAAAQAGYPFESAEFDRVIWDLEIQLAARLGEPFDATFRLWSTMWGRTYLRYLVTVFLPAVTEEDVAAVLASKPA